MFYALSYDKAGYFSDKVSVFVALAPCTKLTHSTYSFMDKSAMAYDHVIQDVENSGVKSVYGPHWDRDLESLCSSENFAVCMMLKNTCIGDGQSISMRTLTHAM